MSTPYERALEAIDAAHAQDPTIKAVDGVDVPYELHYARLMSEYLQQRKPDASEALRLAVRAQHLRRWEVPRSSYPMTRAGYHGWRTFLKKRQAEQASLLCVDSGYDDQTCQRIAALIAKHNLATDPDTQALEDVACLVFLHDQLDAFQHDHDQSKVISILQKTWSKMSPDGQRLALQMPLPDRARELVQMAVT